MKRQPLALALFMAFIFLAKPGLLFSQEEAPGNNLVSVNLLPLAFKSFNLHFERAIDHKQTWSLDANYYINNQFLLFQRFDSRWYGLTAGYQYYTGNMFNSFYLGPYLKYRLVQDFDVVNYQEDSLGLASVATPPQDELWHALGGGVKIGYHYTHKKGFNFGAFLGGGYFPLHWLKTSNPAIAKRRASLIDLRLGISLGWAF